MNIKKIRTKSANNDKITGISLKIPNAAPVFVTKAPNDLSETNGKKNFPSKIKVKTVKNIEPKIKIAVSFKLSLVGQIFTEISFCKNIDSSH